MLRQAWLALVGLATWALVAHAEHATITLRVFRMDAQTGQTKEEATATSDAEPPGGGIKTRPIYKVKAGEPLTFQFIYLNTYPHGVTKDVQIRWFVAREEKAGQKKLPDLKQDVVTQGQFVLNFKPKARVGARLAFTVPEAGVYLLRVDCANSNSDHEHFAAIDLQVE